MFSTFQSHAVICSCFQIQKQIYLNSDKTMCFKLDSKQEATKIYWSCDIFRELCMWRVLHTSQAFDIVNAIGGRGCNLQWFIEYKLHNTQGVVGGGHWFSSKQFGLGGVVEKNY